LPFKSLVGIDVSAKRFTLVTLILFLALSTIHAFSTPKFLIKAEAVEAEGNIYIVAPEQVDASTTERFNVTVWFSGFIEDFFAYQVLLRVDDSILAIEQAWIPRDDPNWVFHGKRVVGTPPALYDDDEDGKIEESLLGDSLLIFPGISVDATENPKILGILQLRIESSPAETTLEIDNPDTIILDSNQLDVPITRSNFPIRIVSQLIQKEPSTITVTAIPQRIPKGQNVTIKGYIEPKKQNVKVQVTIKLKASMESIIYTTTDNQGNFNLSYRPKCTGTPIGGVWKYTIEASWQGDETHYGSKNSTEIIVFVPFSKLEITFGYPDVLAIGEEYAPLPTSPVVINITAYNVTNLHEWKVKVYYDPIYVNITAIWLPQGIYNLTNANLTVNGPNFGREDSRGYMEIEVKIQEPGISLTGNLTILQFNITGLRPTPPGNPTRIEFSEVETVLLNSTGGVIYCSYLPEKGLVFSVLGELPVSFIVFNPDTGKSEFSFYTTEAGVGDKFNVTIRVEGALGMYGWKVKLTYNRTLLSVSRVIGPAEIPGAVFYGKDMNFTSHFNQTGTVEVICMLLTDEPFTGNGTLFIIEFQIMEAPTEGKFESELSFDVENCLYWDGTAWLIPGCINGKYILIYGERPPPPVNVQSVILIVAGAAAILAALGILIRRTRKKEELVFEDDVWEIEIDKL